MCWCLLIPILVGLISALLGYLLGKLLSKDDRELIALRAERDKHLAYSKTMQADSKNWQTKYETLMPELAALKSKILTVTGDDNADKEAIAKLQAELDACKTNSAKLSATINSLEGDMSALKMASAAPILIPFDSALAAKVFGKKIAQDDLKIVEGIGPKIEELFHTAGFKTWKAVSEISVDKCKEILATGGERFQMHDPGTWPRQCLLAYEGNFQELKDWQDKLDGGKE